MKSFNHFLLCALILTLSACKVESDTGKPTVVTSPAAKIFWTAAVLGGDVTASGSEMPSDRGVWWGTNSNPQTGGKKLAAGSGTGVFSAWLEEGLSKNTKYYFQAYATNNAGTSYGEVLFFTTGGIIGTATDHRNGGSFEYTTIGTQTWMIRNLDYLPSVNPSANESQTEKQYFVYDYEGTDVSAAKASANYSTYGVLYNWPAAVTACPANWHLPTDAEWKILEGYLGMDPSELDNEQSRGIMGYRMKLNTGWPSGDYCTNSSGFSALGGGFTYPGGGFGSSNQYAQFWTASEKDASQAWSRYLAYGGGPVFRVAPFKSRGYSVRCVLN